MGQKSVIKEARERERGGKGRRERGWGERFNSFNIMAVNLDFYHAYTLSLKHLQFLVNPAFSLNVGRTYATKLSKDSSRTQIR